jgi:hypothetical protein
MDFVLGMKYFYSYVKNHSGILVLVHFWDLSLSIGFCLKRLCHLVLTHLESLFHLSGLVFYNSLYKASFISSNFLCFECHMTKSTPVFKINICMIFFHYFTSTYVAEFEMNFL